MNGDSGLGADAWKVIGGMGAVIMAMAGYIVKLHLEIGKKQDDRINDLKSLYGKAKKED